MKILVVEDDERVRKMIKTVIADISVAVFECGDGAEACASYAQHQPDWVLMDLTMPELDGIAATREIKLCFPAARIIILTAHDSVAHRRAAVRAGACGFVLKENMLELRELLTTVN